MPETIMVQRGITAEVKAELQSKIKAQHLPVPTSMLTFTADGVPYLKLTFPKGKGPDLEKTKRISDIAKSMGLGEYLTHREGEGIRDNPKANNELREANGLEPGEWTYTNSPEAEKRSQAAWLVRYRYFGGLLASDYVGPYGAAPVVLLKAKKSGSEADAVMAPLREGVRKAIIRRSTEATATLRSQEA